MIEAFPPGFQMIAGMDPSLEGLDVFSECLCPKPCARADGICESDSELFPSQACGEMGIALAFPTCWDDSKGIGDTGDPFGHMAYTVDGTVAGACPEGYNRRLPQIQLFVRLQNYEGGKYTFSDATFQGEQEVFHADFMNGWEEGVLEDIVENCQPVPGYEPDDYNPECTCEDFLTLKDSLLVDPEMEDDADDADAAKICPIDVRKHIVNEEIFYAVGGLPRGSCSAPIIQGVSPPFVHECGLKYTPNTFDEENCEANAEDDDEEWWWDDDEDDEDEDEDDNDPSSEDSSSDFSFLDSSSPNILFHRGFETFALTTFLMLAQLLVVY